MAIDEGPKPHYDPRNGQWIPPSKWVSDKDSVSGIWTYDEVDTESNREILDSINKSDPINPSHYKGRVPGIECIEITRYFNFDLGNAIKYIWRCDDKGHKKEDLEKAMWYIQDEINQIDNQD